MKPVAVFDIDGTVFRSSLLIQLVEALVDSDIFPKEAREVYVDAYYSWQNRESSYEEYIKAVIDSFMRHIKGMHYGDLADVGRQVIAIQQKRVYRYTRDLLGELKDEGYYIVAISQSPKTILDEFCRQYGFDKVYGRIYEIGPQDRFTGEVVDEHLIENKANIINRLRENEDITLEGSVGVGDTEGDIPLLSEVEQPICFNPNKRLYDYAKQMGWQIVVERKDVIYNI